MVRRRLGATGGEFGSRHADGDHGRAGSYPIGMRRHGGNRADAPARVIRTTGAQVCWGSKGNVPRQPCGYKGPPASDFLPIQPRSPSWCPIWIYPAAGLSVEDRDRVADALEAPWGIRQERRLREVFAPDRVAPGESTRRIADVVNDLGLQPWKPPEPLDPIEENLVVWMGVRCGLPLDLRERRDAVHRNQPIPQDANLGRRLAKRSAKKALDHARNPADLLRFSRFRDPIRPGTTLW